MRFKQIVRRCVTRGAVVFFGAMITFPLCGQAPIQEPSPSDPVQIMDEIVLPQRIVVPEVGLRRKAIGLSLQEIRKPGQTFSMQLFEGGPLLGRIDQVKTGFGGIRLVKGTINDHQSGSITFAISGSGATGVVYANSKAYSIKHLHENAYLLIENDPAQQGFCGTDSGDLPGGAHNLPNLDWKSHSSPLQSATHVSSMSGPSVLDIVVVYTQDAADQDLVRETVLGIELLNDSFSNSQLNLIANLVHIEQVQYTETGSTATDLVRLANATDGYLDEVLELRDGLGADLVCLIIDHSTDGFSGRANMLSPFNASAKSMCSIVLRSSIDTLVFAHEIGHNLGGQHNREQNSSGGYHTYSHGLKSTAGQFGTVMSYPTPYGRIPYFSNPSVTYNGYPTGIAVPATNSADNASTFYFTGPLVAGWRSPTYLESPEVTRSFRFTIAGPTSNGNVEYSSDLVAWSNLSAATTGAYEDTSAFYVDWRFYRTRGVDQFTSRNIVGL